MMLKESSVPPGPNTKTETHRETQKAPSISNTNSYRNWLGTLGAILVFFPGYLPNIWGNMTVYVTSYFYREHGNTSIASPWGHVAYTVGFNVGLNMLTCLPRLERKTLLLATITVFNLQIIVMRFALEYGVTSLLFLAFGIAGLCCGNFEQLVFKIITDICGSFNGKYKSIACSGFNFGPFVINYLVGLYMNPGNIPPRSAVDNLPIFDEKDVIDSVPSLLVFMAIGSFACMFTGYCLLLFCLKTSSTKQNANSIYGSILHDDGNQDGMVIQVEHEAQSETDVDRQIQGQGTTLELAPVDVGRSTTSSNGSDDGSGSTNLSVAQILKSTIFITMWFSFGVNIFPKILLYSSYKTYGLLFINNDHFLVILGSAYSLSGSFARLLWGFFLDRFSVKTSLVSVYTFLSLAFLLMYIAAPLDRYLYFFAVVAAAFGINLVLPTFLAAVPFYFGESNFYKVLGMVGTARGLFSLVTSPLFKSLEIYFGWFGTFCFSASVSIVSLILIIFTIPETPKRKEIINVDK